MKHVNIGIARVGICKHKRAAAEENKKQKNPALH